MCKSVSIISEFIFTQPSCMTAKSHTERTPESFQIQIFKHPCKKFELRKLIFDIANSCSLTESIHTALKFTQVLLYIITIFDIVFVQSKVNMQR